MDRVDNHVINLFLVRIQPFELLLTIVLKVVHALKVVDQGIVLLLKTVLEEISDTKAVSVALRSISRSNSLFRRTNCSRTESGFTHSVNDLVGVQNQVSSIGNLKPAIIIHIRIIQRLQLFQQSGNMDYNPVSDDVGLVLVEHSTRQEMKGELLAVHDQCVSSVGPPVKSGDHIIFQGQDIHKFAFALIAPLAPQNRQYLGIVSRADAGKGASAAQKGRPRGGGVPYVRQGAGQRRGGRGGGG
mmetsp:Transcript_30436/g.56872  ORF Transcript_30436/g.56872 Transcript_30436/m.56872 type:complete len:243 (-) Transcript_30436:38-766(-)